MEPFRIVSGPALPIFRPNINTDLIAPTRSKPTPGKTPSSVSEREADPAQLFAALRYDEDGRPQPQFPMNRPEFKSANILIGGENFGCGSSRESAVWMLAASGIRCVIAPSYGEIFYDSCFKSGLLPVTLEQKIVEMLAKEALPGAPEAVFTVDLLQCLITAPGERLVPFSLPSFRRAALLEGLDDIGATLARDDEILSFQRRDSFHRPWVYHLPVPPPTLRNETFTSQMEKENK